MTQMVSRVHDCLVNVHFGDAQQPEWMYRVKNDYFKKDDSIFRKNGRSSVSRITLYANGSFQNCNP